MSTSSALLGEIATIDRRGISPYEVERTTPYVGLEHIDRELGIQVRATVESESVKSTKFAFTSSHILYGKLRPYLAKIAMAPVDGVCSTDILPILAGPKVDSRYLLHFLRSPSQVRLAEQRSSGANLPRLSPRELAAFSVPLPKIEEQKRIARILDTADALRAKRRETIAQLDALVQSVFMEMFGSNHDEWAEAKVAELASNEKGSIRTGPFGSQLLHSEFVEKGIKVLGIDNVVSNSFREGEPRYITSEKYEQLHRYTVRPGDVLITIMGTCGRCAVVPDDIETAINTKHLCAITLDQKRCLPDYLRACFLWHPAAQDFLKRNAKGAIMAGLNMGIIKRLPVIVPPVHLQQHFVDALRSVYAQRERLRAHLDELDTLFASLQSRAFAGEL